MDFGDAASQLLFWIITFGIAYYANKLRVQNIKDREHYSKDMREMRNSYQTEINNIKKDMKEFVQKEDLKELKKDMKSANASLESTISKGFSELTKQLSTYVTKDVCVYIARDAASTLLAEHYRKHPND